jgi:putative membrane protein
MSLAAVPQWQAHVEVWLLVLGLIALGVYTSRVIQPKAVAAGEPPITTSQKRWFAFAVAVFWLSTDFPIHDIAEQRLYSVHMIQHSLLMVVFPPAILLATPTWLARLVIGQGTVRRFVHFWCRPAPALLFNLGLTAFTHSAVAVNGSIASAWVHYGLHTLMVFSALAVWMCVCGPLPELRVNPPKQMLVIFLLSIIPTIPAAFLTTAETILYRGYDVPERLWGLSVQQDQQLAGVIMKVITGTYLWVLIAIIFFRWSLSERGERSKYRGKLVRTGPGVPDGSVPGAGERDGADSQPERV